VNLNQKERNTALFVTREISYYFVTIFIDFGFASSDLGMFASFIKVILPEK